jgi:hypothetical protein
MTNAPLTPDTDVLHEALATFAATASQALLRLVQPDNPADVAALGRIEKSLGDIDADIQLLSEQSMQPQAS